MTHLAAHFLHPLFAAALGVSCSRPDTSGLGTGPAPTLWGHTSLPTSDIHRSVLLHPAFLFAMLRAENFYDEEQRKTHAGKAQCLPAIGKRWEERLPTLSPATHF